MIDNDFDNQERPKIVYIESSDKKLTIDVHLHFWTLYPLILILILFRREISELLTFLGL